MLDFFTIFSKGGIVLWCFQGTAQSFTSSVNSLIKSVILQERGGTNTYNHGSLTLKFKLDNEFELIFVVAYQKILQLSYVDKFLTDLQMEFRNRYKDDLQQGKISRNFDFDDTFHHVLKMCEQSSREEAKSKKKMKSFEQSDKSKKTVASMIENKTEDSVKGKKKGKENRAPDLNKAKLSPEGKVSNKNKPEKVTTNSELDEQTLIENRAKFMAKMKGKPPIKEKKSPQPSQKKGKAPTQWHLAGTAKDQKELDFSNSTDMTEADTVIVANEEKQLVGQMHGALQDMKPDTSSDEEDDEEEDSTPVSRQKTKTRSLGFGLLSGLRNLVGSKTLTAEDIKPALEKMKDHLIAKNVAAEIADKLCESIASKLEGKVLGTFNTVTATVKQSLEEACVQILSPKRRIDILRDAMEAKQHKRPYSIAFCGVNGVGKSTNLAKVAFWLIENGFRVLIAACDTFRAGAVEQLRTHECKLKVLHPPELHGGVEMVQLYQRGYDKDPAGIAMEAINYAREVHFDVVLIDTAGRMQDNERLMRALAKLVKVNEPDLVLFVGEALVGNEAVDQLTKFNQALADHSNLEKPHLLDGILLTKFDTIDDQVGAAISMTYITGQPIVFVGTGQTYTDLKNLNAKAVVHCLLKA